MCIAHHPQQFSRPVRLSPHSGELGNAGQRPRTLPTDGREARCPQPDRALVEAVLAGASGAFERLVLTYQGLCWHIVYRMVRHPDDARELCQEVFLRVHQCLHQYRFQSGLQSWIGRVAYSVASRHLEKKRLPMVEPAGADEDGTTLLDRESDGFDLETACADQEAHRLLYDCIGKLPATQRLVLTLYYLDESSIPEIAETTGLACGTIKSHLFRSRLRLRQALQPQLRPAA